MCENAAHVEIFKVDLSIHPMGVYRFALAYGNAPIGKLYEHIIFSYL